MPKDLEYDRVKSYASQNQFKGQIAHPRVELDLVLPILQCSAVVDHIDPTISSFVGRQPAAGAAAQQISLYLNWAC